MDTTLLAEVAARATPLSLDRDAPLDDLEPLTDRVRDAKVVALGSAVRHSHELLTLTQRVMRWLVDRHGFRALSLEGDEAASLDLDAYVRAGEETPGRSWLGRGRSGDSGRSSTPSAGSDRTTSGAPTTSFASFTRPMRLAKRRTSSPAARTSSDAWRTPSSRGTSGPGNGSSTGEVWRTRPTAGRTARTPAAIYARGSALVTCRSR
jgi:hypothetical protein